MATSIVNNGMTGLMAAQAGILTTSHNIANQTTPGYSRQQIIQTTNLPLATGSGYFGQGTNVQTVQRVYSQYLAGSVMAAQTQVGAMDAYLAQIQQIDNMLADPSAGLSPALSDFFKGVQDMAANPSSVPARQSMISSAQALASRFQSISQSLDQQRQGLNDQITSEISLINSYTSQIAAVNQQIILSTSGKSNTPPNDLLDQRDQLVQSLNKEIRVGTAMQSDGTMSVFIGNGQPAVMATSSFQLVSVPGSANPQENVVGIQALNGNIIELQQDLLTGGTLGGLLSFRTQSLDSAQNELGRVALNLAETFNQQHVLGQDLNGNMGGTLFTFPKNPAGTMDSYINLFGNSHNTGTGALTAQVIQSDYRVVYNGATYDVYRLSGNGTMAPASNGTPVATGVVPGNSVNVDGVTFATAAVAGLTKGDAFTVKPGNPVGTRVLADATNSANATVGAGALTATQSGGASLTATDYRVDFTSFGYVVTRLSDNTVIPTTTNTVPTNGVPSFTFEGITVQPSGVPNIGDSFILQPTRNAARDMQVNITDPRQIAAGAPFRTRIDPSNIGSAKVNAGSMVSLDPRSVPLPAALSMPYNLGTVDAGGTLNVTINGVAKDITIPSILPAAYTPATLATAMTAAITTAFGSNVATAYAVGGNVVLTSPDTKMSVATGLAASPPPSSLPPLNAATVFGAMTSSTGTVTLAFNGPAGVPPNGWTVSTASGAPPQWNRTILAANFVAGQQNVMNINGLQFTVSGSPQPGDKIYLDPNASGVSDNRNGQALGALQTARVMEGNAATYEEAYAQIVSQIGNKTREVMVTGEAQQTLANSANDAVQQMSGVNLDEEASNLIRYQQAYQASAKMIDVGSKLFSTFLQAIG